jgi:hypothetical protein
LTNDDRIQNTEDRGERAEERKQKRERDEKL